MAVPAQRGDQEPAGVASRRAIAFLIHRDSLGWHMPVTPCPSFLLAWGTDAGLGGGAAICDSAGGSYMLRGDGAGCWAPGLLAIPPACVQTLGCYFSGLCVTRGKENPCFA